MEIGFCFFSSTEKGISLYNNRAKTKFCFYLEKDNAQILGWINEKRKHLYDVAKISTAYHYGQKYK